MCKWTCAVQLQFGQRLPNAVQIYISNCEKWKHKMLFVLSFSILSCFFFCFFYCNAQSTWNPEKCLTQVIIYLLYGHNALPLTSWFIYLWANNYIVSDQRGSEHAWHEKESRRATWSTRVRFMTCASSLRQQPRLMETMQRWPPTPRPHTWPHACNSRTVQWNCTCNSTLVSGVFHVSQN